MKRTLCRAAALALLLPVSRRSLRAVRCGPTPSAGSCRCNSSAAIRSRRNPRDRSPAEMARMFQTLCLETAGDGARLAASAAAAGLSAVPHTIPATKKAAPVTLGVWTGDGLVLSQTSGFFAAPNTQCNATFYVRALPDRQALTDALAAVIGRAPSNLASATDKQGRLKKNLQSRMVVGCRRAPDRHGLRRERLFGNARRRVQSRSVRRRSQDGRCRSSSPPNPRPADRRGSQ